MMKRTLALLAAILLLLLLAPVLQAGASPARAQAPSGCPVVMNTPRFTIVWGSAVLNGVDAPAGALVLAKSPGGYLVGCAEIKTAGAYPYMYLYGEDASVTPAIRGMRTGERVTFLVGGVTVGAATFTWSDDKNIHRVDLSASGSPELAASFTADLTAGTAPLTVTFYNTSAGEYDSVLWDFGDGQSSASFYPTHAYSLPGIYAVALTVAGPAGPRTETKPAYISVTPDPAACPLAWKAAITAEDQGGAVAVLSIGQSTAATDGQDAVCGEQRLAPAPPGGIFDARLQLPGGTVDTLTDLRPASATQVVYTLSFQPGPGGFPFTFRWNIAQLPAGSLRLKDPFGGLLVNVDMKTQSSYALTNSAITTLVVEYSAAVPVAIQALAKWNMLSAPTLAADMRLSALFPGAVGSAYLYSGGYQPVSAGGLLQPGRGYWVYFDAPNVFTITGAPVTPRDVAVGAGWSMIGPFESAISVASITSTPAGILIPPVYGYQGGYTSVTTLQPGQGYWVYAAQAGTLRLIASGASGASPEKAETEPASPLNFTVPIRVSRPGGAVTVAVGLSSRGDGGSLAPPSPPPGAFDARLLRGEVPFLRDIRAAGPDSQEYSLLFTPPLAGETISLAWDASVLPQLGRFELADRLTGAAFRMDMAAAGSIEIGPGSVLASGVFIRYTPAPYRVFAPFTLR